MSYIGNAPLSAAFLTDTFSGTGSQVAYTMTVAPANTSSIIVAVTGVLQDPSTYSVSGTTLTFSAAPPSGTSNISVRYLGIPASGVTTTAYRTVTDFTATAGQTSFSVPSYTVGYIDVYRNGVRLAAADYTATNGTTVVLANAATLNDSVVTESFYVSSVLNAIPATAGAVNSTYITDAAVTQAKLAANVAGNGPAFSVSRITSNQSVSLATYTKVQFNSVNFDTNSNWDAVNFRFTPTVAGYYQINLNITMSATTTAMGEVIGVIYKTGVEYAWASSQSTPVGARATPQISTVVYLNGSTDYIEGYGYITSGTSPVFQFSASSARTQMSGCLIRAT
jgi:hypothetical protein